MRQKYWRDRGTYGSILYKRIKRFDRLFTAEYEKGILTNEQGKEILKPDLMDHDKLATISASLDRAIAVQLRNIDKIEESEMLEIMEADNDNKTAIQKLEEATVSQRKF